ncbi:uncharacterized protein LOC119767450 [Culex quinquefasciatus]|uniref:uncharacterized protein LOC119767450 n=1 Tax=Culex quinquefasciatus TaxID=7176 RepID=UPI0018E2E002|nr:uncharacterized protein LOC119767450 [Culex quinquefasciatus]
MLWSHLQGTEGKGAQTFRSRIRKWGHGSNVNVHVRQQPWNVLEEPVPTEGGSSYSTAIKPSPLSSRLRQMAFTSTSMACMTEGESDGDNDTPKHHAVKYDPQDRPRTAAVAISSNRPASFASAADMSMMESSGSKSEATEVDAQPHAHAKNTPTCVAGGNSSSSSLKAAVYLYPATRFGKFTGSFAAPAGRHPGRSAVFVTQEPYQTYNRVVPPPVHNVSSRQIPTSSLFR